jgi:hypothetical protein
MKLTDRFICRCDCVIDMALDHFLGVYVEGPSDQPVLRPRGHGLLKTWNVYGAAIHFRKNMSPNDKHVVSMSICLSFLLNIVLALYLSSRNILQTYGQCQHFEPLLHYIVRVPVQSKQGLRSHFIYVPAAYGMLNEHATLW